MSLTTEISEKLISEIKQYFEYMGTVNRCLLSYFDANEDEVERYLQILIQILSDKPIKTNKDNFKLFLKTIADLSNKHDQKKGTLKKTEKLFVLLKNDIKNTFTESELILIFRFTNKHVKLFLYKHEIISIEKELNKYQRSPYYMKEIKFFYPEIRKFDQKKFKKLLNNKSYKGLKEYVEENDKNFDNFIKCREMCGSNLPLQKLIRDDNIDDFINYVEHTNIDLNKPLEEDPIFKSDSRCEGPPIVFAAFYGSTQIFKYLFFASESAIEKHSFSLCLSSLYGRNYEIIHILEDNTKCRDQLSSKNFHFKKAMVECHHNEIFDYLETNYLEKSKFYNFEKNENILHKVLQYHNYQILLKEIMEKKIDLDNPETIKELFLYCCQYGYVEIVKYLINSPIIDINNRLHVQ